MNELIDALRYCGNFEDREGCDAKCPYIDDLYCPQRIMIDAADAIERLVAEVDRKDKAIQGLLDAVDKKNTDIEKWKAAWKTAYKLHEETKESKGEQNGEQRAEQNG